MLWLWWWWWWWRRVIACVRACEGFCVRVRAREGWGFGFIQDERRRRREGNGFFSFSSRTTCRKKHGGWRSPGYFDFCPCHCVETFFREQPRSGLAVAKVAETHTHTLTRLQSTCGICFIALTLALLFVCASFVQKAFIFFHISVFALVTPLARAHSAARRATAAAKD